MIKRGFKVVTYILTVALFYSWKFLLNSARSHWLLRGHIKLFSAKISERGNNAKKSRRQRVTISSYICFLGDHSLSVYYCCDSCWLRHKTSTDNLVDCYPGSGQLVVIMATLGGNQSERSKFTLDQSESRIWPMWLRWRHNAHIWS